MKQVLDRQIKWGVTFFIALILSSSFVWADFKNIDCVKNQQILGISTDECKVLEKLWESTNGENWLENKGWDTLSSVSTWDGVVISNAKVSSLLLYSNNLKGKIPSELGELNDLKRLSLSDNLLFGELPASLGELSQLVYLELSSNNFTGTLPSSFGMLSSLSELYLNNNQLSGKLPSSLGNLENLKVLKLYENKFEGKIPTTLGRLSKIDSLSLANNHLSGVIPSELGELSELTYLDLKSNKLSGAIPIALGNLEHLSGLYLQNNRLTESIPVELGNLLDLTDLDLSDNSLRGDIPSSLGNLSILRYLNLANNQLSGNLPSSLINLSIMNYLNLEKNRLVFSNIEALHIELSYIPDYKISPQKVVDSVRKIDNLNIGDTLIIESVLKNGSSNNKYAWYKDGILIEDVIGHTFTKKGVSIEDEGVYTYEIVNSLVPQLTLKSHNELDGIDVHITKNLSIELKEGEQRNQELFKDVSSNRNSFLDTDIITDISTNSSKGIQDVATSLHNGYKEKYLGKSLTPMMIKVLSEEELAEYEPATLQIVGTEEAGETLLVKNEGNWSIDDDTIVFTPFSNFNGVPKSIFYTIKDNNGIESNPIEVSIKQNEGKSLTVHILGIEGMNEKLYSVQIVLPRGFRDNYPESILSEDRKELMIETQGIWKIEDNGTASFTPEEGFVGEPEDIEYLVVLKNGDKSAIGILDIKYKPTKEENINSSNNVGLFGVQGLLLMMFLGGLLGMFYIREIENKKV